MKRILVIITLLSVITFSGFGCKGKSMNYQASLEVWGTFDTNNAFDGVFSEYATINPNVTGLAYKKMTIDTYKKDLIDALAAGNGPDVFMIQSSWLPDFQDKIVPVPSYMMTEQEFRNNFVDVVAEDMIVDGQIYGVPLSVDSLGLYYNKDIFNAAGITRPPQTWEEFDKVVKTLTKVDEFGNITQSAAALGTAYNKDGSVNVNRAPDILTLMMIQNGAEMSTRGGNVSFAEVGTSKSVSATPGENALRYYTDFSSATSPIYTWNKNQNYSIDEFYEGSTAMMINYSYHYDTIKAKNAKLNFAVAEVPQVSLGTIGTQANVANYWVFVVAKNKKPQQSGDPTAVTITDGMRIHESWQLLKSISFPSASGVTLVNALGGEQLIYNTKADFTETYLAQTGKPAARRDLIEKQKTDVQLGSFAKGNLIAHSWWRHDADAVDGIMYDMIDRVNTGQMSVHDSLELGQQRIQQLQN